MPRSGGIYTLPPGYFATPGQSIRTEQHNPVLEDIAQAITGSVARDGSSPMLGDLQMNGRKITNLAAGTASGDAANVGQLGITPPGAVMMFATALAPAGWLAANGAAVSRTTYAALFSAIGVTFGAGNGTTTFTLPDLRGEFLRGLDSGRGIDPSRALGSAQAAAMLDHTHSGTTSAAGAHNHSGTILPQVLADTDRGSSGSLFSIDNSTALPTEPDHSHTLTTGNPSAGGGTETRPRNIALLACIKT